MSRLIRTQNRELSFRCMAYNMHRLINNIDDDFYWAYYSNDLNCKIFLWKKLQLVIVGNNNDSWQE